MNVECYSATRTQQGKASNEDAFLIGRGPIPYAVLCDGAGNAQQSAKKVCSLFQKLISEPAGIEETATWQRWIKILDSSLLGGHQSTFVSVAVVGTQLVGAGVGDSRLYLFDREGELRILTENTKRLGSGRAEAFMIRHSFRSGEIVLLMSDGAYGPLNLYALKKAIVSTASRHFSEMPEAILNAGKRGEDDATVIGLRFR
jgi:serine/threonine protein phosphatase PrpC